MRQVCGDKFVQIFRWYAPFKIGVETIEDEDRPGRPFSVRNEGLVANRKQIQFRCHDEVRSTQASRRTHGLGPIRPSFDIALC